MLEIVASYSVKSKDIVPTIEFLQKQRDKYMSIIKTTGIEKISKFNKDLKLKVIYDFLLERVKSDFNINPSGIIVCTQTPDESMPALSSQIIYRNQLKGVKFSYDINSGCTGFVDVCELAYSHLNNLEEDNIVFCFTGDINSRLVDDNDYALSCVFGDLINLTIFKIDFKFKKSYFAQNTSLKYSNSIYKKLDEFLFMNGMEVMSFVNEEVIPKLCFFLENLEKKENLNEYILVLHQANKFIVDFINKKISKKFLRLKYYDFSLKKIGNSGSSTIPHSIIKNCKSKDQRKLVICGFGVGMKTSIGIIKLSKTASFYDLAL